jgi:tetratricopeptide (TPR) repeat protein
MLRVVPEPMMTAFRAPPPLVTVPLPEILVIAREYVDAGRYDAAERVLGHVLGCTPQHAEALHLKGFIAFKRGQIAEAAELMEAGIAAGGASASQLCNLGEVYRMLGRLDDGLAIVRRAAAIAPMDATCHFNESMLRYERMEIDACIRASRHPASSADAGGACKSPFFGFSQGDTNVVRGWPTT